mgnify:CR=1 FL=1
MQRGTARSGDLMVLDFASIVFTVMLPTCATPLQGVRNAGSSRIERRVGPR